MLGNPLDAFEQTPNLGAGAMMLCSKWALGATGRSDFQHGSPKFDVGLLAFLYSSTAIRRKDLIVGF